MKIVRALGWLALLILVVGAMWGCASNAEYEPVRERRLILMQGGACPPGYVKHVERFGRKITDAWCVRQ